MKDKENRSDLYDEIVKLRCLLLNWPLRRIKINFKLWWHAFRIAAFKKKEKKFNYAGLLSQWHPIDCRAVVLITC